MWLGVYTKKDILKTIKGKSNRNQMALRFSMTERFAKPVNLHQLRRLGIRSPFMSPRKITAEQFASIYSFGFDITHD
jgi:predicted transcriptional regulator